MTFDECINNAAAAGDISGDDAAWIKKRFRQYKDGGMADEAAGKALSELLAAETAHKRKKAKLAIKAVKRIDADLRNHRNASGELDIAEGARMMLEHFGEAKFDSVAGRQRAIVGMAHARMDKLLFQFRRGRLAGDKGRWNKAQLDNVAREAFGEGTGDAAAKEFARVWEDTHEWLRQRFNAAGGAIGKLERWGLPQAHDARALREVGRESWKAEIRPKLDVARMKHPLSGNPVDPAELDGILDDIWQNVVTDGWHDRQPSLMAFGRGALANQRAEHRFLIFRSADDWLSYQRDFGRNGDVFGAMMGHINMMAKDIAALEILGPNPNGMVEWMRQAVMKQAQLHQVGERSSFAGDPKRAIDRANSANKKITALWGSIRGELETPVNSRMAATFGGIRSLITASVMGSAALSSVSDIGTSIIARRFTGIGSTGAFSDIVKAFGGATEREAVASGLILDSAAHVFHAQARYIGTIDGPGWSQFIADRVLALSGLTAWTQAGKHAFGLAFMHEAANLSAKSFDQLPDAFRNTFHRHGITAKDWEFLRTRKLHDMGSGAKILRPTEVAIADETLALRYLSMIQKETTFAIPEGGHRSRVALLNQNQPGTLMGEVLRSFAMFKSFGAVFVILHGLRITNLLKASQPGKAAAYAGSLLISTTLFGGLALQLKQLAAGRDPRDMKDEKFWTAALLQGGGLGIYGDFLFANINRFGGGFTQTLGGPVVQRADDLWNLTAGNLVQLASGEKTQFGRELVRFLKGNVPGSNIWYIRTAWERNVMDQLQFLMDPEAAKAFKRQQRYWQRNYGQEYWWRPGERLPDRAPDMAAINGS